MSRHSSRLKTIPGHLGEDTVNPSDDQDFVEEEEELEEPEFVPQKKRRKGVKATLHTDEDQKMRKVRGRRGALSSLKEFPLDVLFEIFGHLSPKDLLNLARTTKDIRGILTTRSNAFVWKDSRAQVEGLPEIPRDLTEPQYAALAFDSHCHTCLTTPVQTVIWTARMRLCKKCMQEDYVAWPTLHADTQLEIGLLELVPSFEERVRSRRRGWRLNMFYSLSFARKLKEEAANYYRQVGALQEKKPEYAEWYKGKSDEMKDIQTHAKLCATWLESRKNDRTDELDEARRLRLEAIVERLTALGWGEEISHHDDDLKHHKLVRQPKALTDRIWKNIEEPLIEFLTGLKKTRLANEHIRIVRERRLLAARVYKDFKDTFPVNTIFPAQVDMIRTEPFRTVIEDTPTNPEVKVTEESFAAALLYVPDFSSEWRRSKDKELVEIMKKTAPNSTEADLHLATTFFAYSTGSEAIGYPRILVSSYATQYSWREDPHSLTQTLREDSWNANGSIRFHERASLNVRAVLQACGLDPDVTTAAEMDEINPAIECLDCYDTFGSWIMRWIHTATHAHTQVLPGALSWRCLRPDEELQVEKQEREVFMAPGSSAYSWREDVVCKFCDTFPKANIMTLRAHLLSAHNIEQLTLDNVQYILDAGISGRHPLPLRLKPPVVEKEVGGPSELEGETKETGASEEATKEAENLEMKDVEMGVESA